MSGGRVWAISLRIMRQFRRDHRTLVLLFVVPLVLLTLLRPLIEMDVPIRLGISDEDESVVIYAGRGRPPIERKFSDPIIEALSSDDIEDLAGDGFQVTTMTPARIEAALKAGDVDGGLLIPRDFSEDIAEERTPELDIRLEGTDEQVNRTVQMIIGQAAAAAGDADGPAPRVETTYKYGGGDLTALDYFAPVFVAFFVFFFVFLLTSVSFLRERSQGTMERLMVSPAGRFEIITGYMAGFFFFAALQSIVILLYTVYALDVTLAAPVWEILFIELLLTLGSVNLGIFLSSFARTELQVVQFIPMVITPQVLLSGMIWPVRAMPPFLQTLSSLMPLTYANSALTDLMIKGLPLSAVRGDIAFLLGFAILMVALSALTLGRRAS